MHGSTLPRPVAPAAPAGNACSFLWLEITGKCQLSCIHCYADSGPGGTHGSMTRTDWKRVIDQAAALGVTMVQFIGGEPTLHPDLPALVEHALLAGVEVEIYSNLVHVTEPLWNVFAQDGVRLACSYYSDSAAEHAAITGRRTHGRTLSSIMEAVQRRIPLRVGLVDLGEGQRVEEAMRQLADAGVEQLGTDRLRGFGRGAAGQPADMSQLCGQCATDVLAVGPDGTVWPCVFSRKWPVGNVLQAPFGQILAGQLVADTRDAIGAAPGEAVRQTAAARPCQPQMAPCQPSVPCRPQAVCGPRTGTCAPKAPPCKPRSK